MLPVRKALREHFAFCLLWLCPALTPKAALSALRKNCQMQSCGPFFPPLSVQHMATAQNNCRPAGFWHISSRMMMTYRSCWMTSSWMPSLKLLACLHCEYYETTRPCSPSGPALAETMCDNPRRAAAAGATSEEAACCPACNAGANPRMVAEEIRRRPTQSHVGFKAGKEAS